MYIKPSIAVKENDKSYFSLLALHFNLGFELGKWRSKEENIINVNFSYTIIAILTLHTTLLFIRKIFRRKWASNPRPQEKPKQNKIKPNKC